MPVFQYKGFDVKGKPTTGIKDADNPRALRQALKREGILPTEIKISAANVAAGDAGPAAAGGALGGALHLLSPARISRWLQERGDASPQIVARKKARPTKPWENITYQK